MHPLEGVHILGEHPLEGVHPLEGGKYRGDIRGVYPGEGCIKGDAPGVHPGGVYWMHPSPPVDRQTAVNTLPSPIPRMLSTYYCASQFLGVTQRNIC